MKKLLALFLSISLMLCFASCGNTDTQSGTSSASGDANSAQSAVSSETTSSEGGVTSALPTVEGAGNTTADITFSDVDNDGVIRIACVGDSITGGNPGANYPEFLQEYLDYQSTIDGKTYEVTNHGKGGAAVRHYLEDLEGSLTENLQVKDDDGDGKVTAYFYYDDYRYLTSLDYTADVVIVQMGTNDCQGDNWSQFNSYFKNDYYEYLIKPYVEKGSQVIISTAPWSYEYTNINNEIYNAIIEIAQTHELSVVDTNRLMTDMYEVFDGVHCNKSGYRIMAQNFFKYIFGGELITAKFNTVPDASVQIKDNDSGNEYVIGANDEGVAEFSFIPDKTYNFTCSASCTGYKAKFDIPFTFEKDGDSVTIELTEGQNVAISGTAFAGDAEIYDERHIAATINDGDKGTAVGYQAKTHSSGDYVGITFDKAYSIDTVLLYWESSSSINEYTDGGYEVYFEQNGQYTEIGDATFARSNAGATIDTLVLSSPAQNVTGIKVVFLNASGKAAPKLNELEAF